jgi:hypothetical protein
MSLAAIVTMVFELQLCPGVESGLKIWKQEHFGS